MALSPVLLQTDMCRVRTWTEISEIYYFREMFFSKMMNSPLAF